MNNTVSLRALNKFIALDYSFHESLRYATRCPTAANRNKCCNSSVFIQVWLHDRGNLFVGANFAFGRHAAASLAGHCGTRAVKKSENKKQRKRKTQVRPADQAWRRVVACVAGRHLGTDVGVVGVGRSEPAPHKCVARCGRWRRRLTHTPTPSRAADHVYSCFFYSGAVQVPPGPLPPPPCPAPPIGFAWQCNAEWTPTQVELQVRRDDQ